MAPLRRRPTARPLDEGPNDTCVFQPQPRVRPLPVWLARQPRLSRPVRPPRLSRPARPPRLSRRLMAAIALMAAAAVWGATFLVVKNAVARMPVFDFLAWRFTLAAGLLVAARPRAVLGLARPRPARGLGVRPDVARGLAASPRPARGLGVRGLRHGVLLGVVLGLAYATQAIGLQHTPAAVSGFVTGLFVVFTPVLSWLLLRRRLAPSAWFAVLLAGGGLALITLGGFAVGSGELLTLVCAMLFALQIIGTSEWSAGHDSFALTTVQLATVAALSMIAAVATGQFTVPGSEADWLAITITAVLASALAYTVQTWAQTWLSATQAAVILTTEPVFAAIFAVALGGETLGLPAIAGGVLVVAAMYLIHLRMPAEPQPGAAPGHKAQGPADRSLRAADHAIAS
jgi:drug/metabolite transporter (DMT)-like permease